MTTPRESGRQDELYREAATGYSVALERLAKAYEADPDKRRDLLQEIHVALWRSFAGFNNQCSLRTWIYRVAHNTAASHVIRDRRTGYKTWINLDELEEMADEINVEESADRNWALERLMKMIQRLNPLERQVILLYLEGLDAAAIGEIAGISPSNAATKIHRIKNTLVQRFHQRKAL